MSDAPKPPLNPPQHEIDRLKMELVIVSRKAERRLTLLRRCQGAIGEEFPDTERFNKWANDLNRDIDREIAEAFHLFGWPELGDERPTA